MVLCRPWLFFGARYLCWDTLQLTARGTLLHMDAANRRLTDVPRNHLEYLYSLPNQLFGGQDHSDAPYITLEIPKAEGGKHQLFFVTHHLCHAAHAFFESPFEEAAILTVDDRAFGSSKQFRS